MLNKNLFKGFLLLALINNSACGNNINNTLSEKDIVVYNSSTVLDIDGLKAYNIPENNFKIKFNLSDYDNYNNSEYNQIDDDKSKILYNLIKGLKILFSELVKINDVVLSDTNKSILGDNSPDSIKPDYAGKDIFLELKGNFKIFPLLNIDALNFKYEDGLIAQSFVTYLPLVRVLIDDSILCTPVSVSSTSVKVKINTKNIPEFYLKGMHKLSFEISDLYSKSVNIKVGDPSPTSSLSPKIDSVEVIKVDNKPVNLKLKGKNFMMFYKYSYSKIDNVFGFGHKTDILSDGSWESVIHIPDPSKFNLNQKHTITYSSPFGTAFKSF